MPFKIVNKLRFFVSVTILTVIFLILISIISNTFIAEGMQVEEKIVVEVEVNDTLWSIAKEHGSKEMDIRETIYLIKKINELESAMIYPGQELEIPQ